MTLSATDITFRDEKLVPIWEKLLGSRRLDKQDGLTLLQTWDLTALGKMADHVKQSKTGENVFFVMNRQINPTNLCVLDCTFCDFAAKPGDPHAYEMSIDEILRKLDEEITEVHIVGGLHPKWRFEDYLGILEAIHQSYPSLQIKAWTAVEIDWFARIGRMSLEEVIERMKEKGLRSLPGGGAEVFSERVRRETFKNKIGADRWFEVHRIAHRMGIPSNATLLYGHIETYEERIDHMLRLRRAQEEEPGFLSFIPLALQPGNTGLAERQASAIEDLRTVATARLLLDNFDHIKSYWVMLGEDTASVALNFGASDLDGTIGEERIAHYAQAKSAVGLARDRLLGMIRESGKTPVERDALYNVIRVYH
ncbi:MAG TPA: aminofutalosine synthase MqnE [Vicinamibacteria bacterium]|nr:aminofutalosine synthase MqnE [Vicinamibacteria bacterium]